MYKRTDQKKKEGKLLPENPEESMAGRLPDDEEHQRADIQSPAGAVKTQSGQARQSMSIERKPPAGGRETQSGQVQQSMTVEQKLREILTLPESARQEQIQKLAESGQKLNVKLVNDFAFKRVFHNKKALTGLLAALLEIPVEEIKELEFLDPFQQGDYVSDKEGILDVKVHLNNERKINIELQVREQSFWKERSLFYLSRMYTSDLTKGVTYSALEPCIHISILTFDVLELDRLYSVVRLVEEKSGKVYSDKMSLRVLYLKKIPHADEEERKTEVYQWAKLISAKDWKDLEEMAMQDEYKQEAVNEMERINSDPALRYRYITREIEQMDRNSMREDYIEQGIKIGEERGVKIGEERGVKMGEKRVFELLERMKASGEEARFWQLKDDPEQLRKKYEEYQL